MSHYRIFGRATTTAPLHIAQPGDYKVDINGRSTPGAAFPMTAVQTMRYYLEDGTMITDPVIPANTIRGGLRRKAATILEDALIANGERVDWRLYNAIRVGTPHGQLSTMSPTAKEHEQASGHVYAGLFGGGQAMYRSRLIINTAIPVSAEADAAGLLPPGTWVTEAAGDEGSEKQQYGPRFRDRIFYRRFDDLKSLSDPNLERVLDDWITQIDEYQALTGRQLEDEEGGSKATMRGLNTFTAMEIVRPGVPFGIDLEVAGEDEAGKARVGMALKAIEALANSRMGGWVRNGFGRMAWDLSLATPDGETVKVLSCAQGRHELNTSNELVAEVVEAAEEKLEAVTAAELEKIFLNGKDEKLAAARKRLREAEEA